MKPDYRSEQDAIKADELDALLASLPDQGWQDISTAPKDGTMLILGNFSAAAVLVGNGRWADGGWLGLLNPTHWMPLPLPPRDTP